MASAWLTQKLGWMARDRRSPDPVRPDLRRPLGEWLSSVPWDWFVTLTFAVSVHPEQADKRFRRWIWLLKRERRKVGWVRVLESQERQVLHIHALFCFAGREEARRLTAMHRWEEIGQGYARISSYDPQRGGTYYLGKDLVNAGEIDFGGLWWQSGGGCDENGDARHDPADKSVVRHDSNGG
jgi:hypothetical protein